MELSISILITPWPQRPNAYCLLAAMHLAYYQEMQYTQSNRLVRLLSACFFFLRLGAVYVAGTSIVIAQELEPRTFANTPTGVNIFSAGYAYSSGNVLLDPTLPIEDLDGKLNIGLIGYGRTFGLFNRNAKLKVFVPYAFGDWKGEFEGAAAEREAQGFGDIRLKLEWNFFGAPALNGKQFQSYQQKTIVGTSVMIVAPTSDYNSDELLNLGSNRWAVRTELGVSRAIGSWTLELIGNVWWFGSNNNFVGGNKLEQDPLYVAKGHLIYSFRPGLWVGFGLGYGRGGQSQVNGVPRATEQENFRFGLSAAYPINKQHGLVGSFTRAQNSGAGAEFDVFSLRYQYAWGGDK